MHIDTYMHTPSGSAVKGPAGDPGSIPGLGRSPGGGNGKPTPVFLPGGSHGQRVAQNWTQLSTHTHACTACHAKIPDI